MKFIVIEGLDGSGKSTQIKLIEEYLQKRNIKSRFLHFPRMDAPYYGNLISRFLRGELGAIDKVDPYVVALLYAGDRADASKMIRGWLRDGYAVIADRYLYSNIGFQCAKINNFPEKEKLAKWIKALEYEYNNIPIPDLNLFLKVPFSFTASSLNKRRKGKDREYLKGADDIHESDLKFQEDVRDIYLWQVKENIDFDEIDCGGKNNSMLSPVEIFKKIEVRINDVLNI
jgi:dTMP kinase